MKLIFALFVFAGALLAQNPSPCTTVQNAAIAGQVLSAATNGRPPQCRWITGGGGGGGISQVTGTLPIQVANTTTTPVVSCRTATGLVSGCLSAADWTTFNGKAASNASTSVNGQTCTLGSGCTVTVAISTGVTGLGTNVATFLGTPSGANLASALTTSLPNTKGGTGGDSSGSTGIAHVAAGTWSYSPIVNADITNSTIDLAAKVTGNLAVTHLNSGTSADNTHFWRGDGTWAVPAGGGGATHGASFFIGACDQSGNLSASSGTAQLVSDSGSTGVIGCSGVAQAYAFSVLSSGATSGFRTVGMSLAGWDGSSNVGITITFMGNTTANGTVVFGVSTWCPTLNTDALNPSSPTYNAEQTVTVNEGTVAVTYQKATIASLTTTGCAANSPIVVRILRKSVGTSVDGIYFSGVSFTY